MLLCLHVELAAGATRLANESEALTEAPDSASERSWMSDWVAMEHECQLWPTAHSTTESLGDVEVDHVQLSCPGHHAATPDQVPPGSVIIQAGARSPCTPLTSAQPQQSPVHHINGRLCPLLHARLLIGLSKPRGTRRFSLLLDKPQCPPSRTS